MNSQLRHIKDTIRSRTTGEVGAALDVLLNLCAAYQTQISELGDRIKKLEEQTKQRIRSKPNG